MKLSLTGRQIPRNKQGDPFFVSLTPISDDESDPQPSVLQIFSPEEVVELVNRSLYQLEYQSKSHSKYREQREALERPIKQMFKQLYPHTSYAKATDEQLRECVARLKENK